MTEKRYLALDVGERRTGVAATDATGTICVPLDRIDHSGMNEVPKLVEPIVRERETEVLVVGVPLDADGSAGPQARKVLEIVTALRRRFPDVEVVTADESASTGVAHQLLKDAGVKAAKRRKYTDSLAAMTILQRHLGWPESPR